MAKFTTYDFVVTDRAMVAAGKGFSWRSYTDVNGVFGNPGERKIFDDGSKDQQGRPIGKAFSLNQSHYKLQAREGQKDVSGMALVDFFRNAPFCLGSPNGKYSDPDGHLIVDAKEIEDRRKNIVKIKQGELIQHNVKIKELDDELDAKLALETGLKRAEAQISAGQIDEQTLNEIAAMIGEFDKPEKTLRLKVYEFAGKRPLDYFKYLEAGDRPVRAMIRMAIDKGIMTQKGPLYYWGDLMVGNSEDAVVGYLDDDLKKSLAEKLDFKSDNKKRKK